MSDRRMIAPLSVKSVMVLDPGGRGKGRCKSRETPAPRTMEFSSAWTAFKGAHFPNLQDARVAAIDPVATCPAASSFLAQSLGGWGFLMSQRQPTRFMDIRNNVSHNIFTMR